jgi:DNA-binding SARP family transcriptional activator/TolB-like protein
VLRLRTFGGVLIEAADGTRVPSPRPQRLALLLIVAAAGRRGVSRNRLLTIFWPDTDEDRARHALSQSIYALRRDLDPTLISAENELRLESGSIASDVQEFREATARRDWPAAYALYQGPFAAGFSFDDAPEFERWLEEERAALARDAAAAFQALAREAATAGDQRRAAEIWQRLTGLDPVSARFAVSYMSALVTLGDRAGAIAHAKQYAVRVRRELDAEPDPDVIGLADRLRQETRARGAAALAPEPGMSAAPTPTAPVPSPVAEVQARTEPAQPASRSRALVRGGIAAGILVALAGSVLAVRSVTGARPAPVLAVGQIRDLTAPDSAQLGGVLSEVLATSLARLSDVEVIANSRIIELLRQGTDTIRSARTDAARRAGATEIIEGELVPEAGGRIRLALRRVSLGRGSVRGGYSVSGSDRLALLDSVTSLIAADLNVSPPVRSLAEFTARSPIALRLYEEGLRAYYLGDPYTAKTLFREALQEDSTFAMAAFYGNRATHDLNQPDEALQATALKLASRAPDRERLLILTTVYDDRNEPIALLYADTLLARFPRDPEAVVRAVGARLRREPITDGLRDALERAIAIDSSAPANPKALCRLCQEYASLTTAYRWADSGAAAERSYRRWIAARPQEPGPVREFAMQQFYLGRYEAGAALVSRMGRLPPEAHAGPVSPLFYGRLLTGHLDEVDQACAVQLREEENQALGEYVWLCTLLYRYQGRYRDASALTFSARVPGGGTLKQPFLRDPVREYVLDLEMDRPLLALRVMESALPDPKGYSSPGLYARDLTWALARRATAAVMAREYDLARRLADSTELVGQRSLYGRDPRLHFFVRGLLAAAAGDHQSAVDLYRRSIYSPNFGFTRANLELGRSLLALGRAADAVPVLQASLRGGWDGSNLYVSRTEIHEMLAQAFAASGRRDSAAAHFRQVESAWRHADPFLAERYQAARAWLDDYDRVRR